ncbi:Transposase [Cordylochernes scorpioides]|uniref:Transposase n=1 Tax=Cordylochernes scorpioides TaxID=51811 RepID=A0ABY6L2D4_9ARAC|nr:Transposase [Cordylochernes scorpioides]
MDKFLDQHRYPKQEPHHKPKCQDPRHPAHPASAHQSCIACGSGDLSLVHRYCSYIRPLIREEFTIIPPDLQGWVFGHGLDDDALAILASAKTRIYRHFLGAELRSVQEDPLLVWRRTLSRTISRRLVANGLHSCRPLRRLPLTPPNRRQRLEWCRARSTWMTEWHRVVFSDESRFCLSSDSRRVRVWRRRGERSNPAAIVERPTVRQRGIMVWGAIAYDSRSPLLRIQGTMTAQRYVDDVLRPVTLPYLQGVPNALYQQDNARPHTARISQQALQDVQMLPWPPYSPDLSPIEHVWDIIGRRLHALPQPRSEAELWQMVEREWRAIPQDAIRTLIDSLPRRVAACIAVRGGPTCY